MRRSPRSRPSLTPSGQALWNTLGQASFRSAFTDPFQWDEEDDHPDEPLLDEEGQVLDPETMGVTEEWPEEGGDEFIQLAQLGAMDINDLLDAIDEITDKYLTNVEGDLIWLMRKGRRPVEISRILRIPECEVVRLRRNCYRKIRVVFMLDYYRDKHKFVRHAIALLGLNDKQGRILTMFFDYYGLRPIAEVIGTRPSNVHRSLESIRKKLEGHILPGTEFYPFLEFFASLKYLNVQHRQPPE